MKAYLPDKISANLPAKVLDNQSVRVMGRLPVKPLARVAARLLPTAQTNHFLRGKTSATVKEAVLDSQSDTLKDRAIIFLKDKTGGNRILSGNLRAAAFQLVKALERLPAQPLGRLPLNQTASLCLKEQTARYQQE